MHPLLNNTSQFNHKVLPNNSLPKLIKKTTHCLKRGMLRDEVNLGSTNASTVLNNKTNPNQNGGNTEDLNTILGRITNAFNKIETG